MERLFKNTELNNSFENLGYCLIPNFLSSETIKELRNYYLSTNNDLGQGFHATSHSKSYEYKVGVNQKIKQAFFPQSSRFLNNCTPIIGNFTIKEPGENSFFDFHLDWSMVDERKHKSFTIWVPLETINKNNGHLWILEKSHTLGYSVRCGPGLQLIVENHENLSKKFQKKVLNLSAGTAVIYDHRLFHGSPPNLTDKPRLAINFAMRQKNSVGLHYHFENNLIESYKVDPDFYTRYVIGKKPEKELLFSTEINKGELVYQDRINHLIQQI